MITKSARDKTNFKRNINFTNSAREGWGLILETLNTSDKILLPSYIGITEREGSGIYDPIVSLDIEHDFYSLTEDLSIPLLEIEKLISAKEYKMILLVHYFGFQIRNIKEIITLCRKNNIVVVEDCAHLFNYHLFNYSSAGTFGDFAFYSLHKYLPIKNGGMVLQNTLNYLTPDFTNVKLLDTLSLELLKYDIKEIADKRRENFILLDTLIKKVKGVKPLKTMDTNDIPHNYPIIVEGGFREKLYFWLIKKNIPLIALYYRLIDPLQNKKYDSMLLISNSILNLPIHQDMDSENIQHVVETLEQGLFELKS